MIQTERVLTLAGQLLFQEAEDLLDKWKHPDPFRPCTAPGGELGGFIATRQECSLSIGSKYERNIPAPILDRMSPSTEVLGFS